MNHVLGRIAQLQARFEPLTRPAVATTSSSSSAAFSSALTSAQRAAAAGTASGDDSVASLIGGLARSAGSGSVDTTAYAALSRLLQTANSTTTSGATPARATAATSTSAIPAAYSEYATTIAQIATDEGVPASLLAALVWSESSFDPDAVSSAGARGLAQLMPATAAGLGVDIDNPIENLRGGARYLRQMLDRFGSPELALAAYNAGPGAVTRANGVPDYPETKNYVTKVTARAAALAGAIA